MEKLIHISGSILLFCGFRYSITYIDTHPIDMTLWWPFWGLELMLFGIIGLWLGLIVYVNRRPNGNER